MSAGDQGTYFCMNCWNYAPEFVEHVCAKENQKKWILGEMEKLKERAKDKGCSEKHFIRLIRCWLETS